MHDLARTLELLAEGGARELYGGDLGRTVVEYLAENGGLITPDDLAAYRVIWRRPIRVPYAGDVFVSNPPPSSGGILIGYGLMLLDELGGNGEPGSAEAIAALVEVMREQLRARQGSFVSDLHRGGLARRLYSDERVRAALARIEQRDSEGAKEASGAPGTTHISVVDERGNAASLTASIGSGSGVIVPGTGIHMNNMLGEYDLNPPGRGARPGERLTSMMAPSIVLDRGAPRLVVGSAGSIRLRGAILQIVVNVIRHGLSCRGGDLGRRVSIWTKVMCTARGAPIRRSSTSSSAPATSSCAGGSGISTSEAPRRWSGWPMAAWRQPAIHGAAGMASSSRHE